jgi:hypothetical protein
LDEINATFWRILRDAYLQPIARSLGKRTIDLTTDEGTELLGPFFEQMLAHQAQLEEVGEQHGLAALARMHDAPDSDTEMEIPIVFSNDAEYDGSFEVAP